MASLQPLPTPGVDFFQHVLLVAVGLVIGGLWFLLGFSLAQDRNPAVRERAAMLDKVVDYVNFLRLQVKVLSMYRLCGAKIPPQPAEGGEAEIEQHQWNECLIDRTEGKVPKLVEEYVGATMQFLESKVMCIMQITLATATICHSHHQQPRPPLAEIPDHDAPS